MIRMHPGDLLKLKGVTTRVGDTDIRASFKPFRGEEMCAIFVGGAPTNMTDEERAERVLKTMNELGWYREDQLEAKGLVKK